MKQNQSDGKDPLEYLVLLVSDVSFAQLSSVLCCSFLEQTICFGLGNPSVSLLLSLMSTQAEVKWEIASVHFSKTRHKVTEVLLLNRSEVGGTDQS